MHCRQNPKSFSKIESETTVGNKLQVSKAFRALKTCFLFSETESYYVVLAGLAGYTAQAGPKLRRDPSASVP